jgi:hypothetical protein
MIFKKGDIVTIKNISVVFKKDQFFMQNKLYKNLRRLVIGNIGKIYDIQKNPIFKRNIIKLYSIRKCGYRYSKYTIEVFSDEIKIADEYEKNQFLEFEEGLMQYNLARKL